MNRSSTTGYNPENETMVHQEAPVKFMKYIDDGQGAILWNRDNPKKPDLFTHLEQFTREVIIKDAIAYNHGRPLQDIDMNYQRSSASHAMQAAQRSQGGNHPPL